VSFVWCFGGCLVWLWFFFPPIPKRMGGELYHAVRVGGRL